MRLRLLIKVALDLIKHPMKSGVQPARKGGKQGAGLAAPSSLGANERQTMTILGKAVSAIFVMSILGTLVLMVAPDLHGAFCAVVR